MNDSPQEGKTDFEKLSEEAQCLIVDAVLGIYDDTEPPKISENVRAEIANWASQNN